MEQITTWKTPITIQEIVVDNGISWDLSAFNSLDKLDFKQIKTHEPLQGISNTTFNRDGMTIMETNKLVFTGFNFSVTGTILGIELEIKGQRYSRVTDQIVQLHLNERIGQNMKQLLDINENYFSYGGPTDLWQDQNHLSNLTAAKINDPLFGVMLQFRSHPHFPHRDTAYVDQLRMRVYYDDGA